MDMKTPVTVGCLALCLVWGTWAAAQAAPAPAPSDTSQAAAPAEPWFTHWRHATYELPPGEDPQNKLVLPLLKHMATDQLYFWTGPTRLEKKDLRWLIPASAATAAFIASDSWVFEASAQQARTNSTRARRSGPSCLLADRRDWRQLLDRRADSQRSLK